MIRLILIRHGETDYHLEKRYCGGMSDPPLNKKGIQQSERLYNRLKSAKIDSIYSSDFRRAIQSAQIIFKNALIKYIPDFREMNFGIFDGLTYEEIITKYPKVYNRWIKEPTEIKIPNGESLSELATRVKSSFYKILNEDSNKTVALVTHGGPIRVILCETSKWSLRNFWHVEQELGALSIIDYFKESPPVVVKMNDTSHLHS